MDSPLKSYDVIAMTSRACSLVRMDPHLSQDACSARRVSLIKKKGCLDASRILGLLFSVNGDGFDVSLVCTGMEAKKVGHEEDPDHGDFVEPTTPRNDSDTDSSDAVEDDYISDENRINISNQWITISIPNSFKATEVLEALLDNIQFSLGEPTTLVFFSLCTHKGEVENRKRITKLRRIVTISRENRYLCEMTGAFGI